MEKQYKKNNSATKDLTVHKIDRIERDYLRFSTMSDEDIEKRLDEIKNLKGPLEKKLRALYTKFGQEQAEKMAAEDITTLKRLQREEKDLRNFPSVRTQIGRIISLRNRTINNNNNNNIKIESLEKEIGILEDKNKALREKIRLINEKRENDFKQQEQKIMGEIQEIKRKLEAIDQEASEIERKDDITPEETERYGALCADRLKLKARNKKLILEKENLRKVPQQDKEQSKIDELQAQINRKKTALRACKNKPSIYGSMVNKCNMAWRMLYLGKSWDEIELVSIENAQKGQDEGKTDETKVALDTKTFADKHPVLAKIPFVAKLANKIAEIKSTKSEQATPGSNQDKTEADPIREQKELFLKYLKEFSEKGVHTEPGKYVTVEPKEKKTDSDEAKKEKKEPEL